MDGGHVLFLSQLCDPKGVNVPLQTPETGKMYHTNSIVMSIYDPTSPYFSALRSRKCTKCFAQNEFGRPKWQYQVPTFINNKRAKP